MTTTRVLSGESFVADVVDQGHIGSQQILVVGLCLVLNMLDGFDITAMAVVATSVSGELGLTADQLGWVFSFALAGMMAGAMLLAPVSDLIGRRKMVILSVALVAVSILLTARASSLAEFIVLPSAASMPTPATGRSRRRAVASRSSGGATPTAKCVWSGASG